MARAKSGLTAVRQVFEDILTPPYSYTLSAANYQSGVRDGKGHAALHTAVSNNTSGTIQVFQSWDGTTGFILTDTITTSLDAASGLYAADIECAVSRRYVYVKFTGTLGASFVLGAYFLPRASRMSNADAIAVTVTPTANRSTFATGQKNVTTAGTPEQVGAQAIPDGFAVKFQAKVTNTNDIFLGNSSANALSTTVRKRLAPGDSVTLYITNTNLMWLDVTTNGEGLDFIVET